MENLKGACGCGGVEYTVNSKILNIVNCHCNMCRNHNGSSFSTYAVAPSKSLEIIIGKELINQYAAGDALKHFCSNCGTPLFNTNQKYPGACMLFSGTLSNVESLVPKINVWCESKLAWVDNLTEIASFSQGIENK